MQSTLLALATLALFCSPAMAAQSPSQDPETGAQTWQNSSDGVTLSLTQILPDQARAFYLNRGFSAEAAERFAGACVFMTVLRNDAAPGELSFVLADWQVRHADQSRPPLAVETWLAQWQVMGLTEAAQIAFRWAQFPPQQDYAVGEWNQGMLSTGLPAGSTFNLIARWSVSGKTYQGVLENVACAR